MTQNEFARLCEEMCIAPSVALECDEVRDALQAALQAGDAEAVKQALLDNF